MLLSFLSKCKQVYFILLPIKFALSIFHLKESSHMINYDHIRTEQPPQFQKNHLPILSHPHSYLLSNPITPLSISKSPSTQGSNKSHGYYIYDEGYDRRNLKKLLYEDYQAQLRMKKERDSVERKRQSQLDRKFLQKTQELQAQIKWHDFEKKLTKQKELTQDYQQKQELKKHSKLLEAQQKTKQRELLQSKKPLDKRAIFQEFYHNCDKGMRQNSKMYLDKVAPWENFRQVEKQKLTEAGIDRIAHKYSDLYQNLQHENKKRVNQLKTELVQQKLQKQHMRRYNSEQKLQQVNRFNTIESNYHNPILNPVNLGVNPENKYVIAEIRKKMERAGSRDEDLGSGGFQSPFKREANNQYSSLARNGSKILL